MRGCVQVFSDQGVEVDEISVEEFEKLAELKPGRMTSVEAYLNFKKFLENNLETFDPIVCSRMMGG